MEQTALQKKDNIFTHNSITTHLILPIFVFICFINNIYANHITAFNGVEEEIIDSSTVFSYYKKARLMQRTNIDSARFFLSKGLKIAAEIDSKPQLVKGNWLMANLELKQRNRAVADSIFQSIIEHPTWVDSTTFCAIRIDYAHLLYLQRKTDRALLIYQSIIPYLKAKDNVKLLVICHINQSKLMVQKHQYKQAMRYLVDAEKLAKKHQLESKLAIIYGTMGRLYFQEKDYNQSLECFNQSLFYHTKLNNVKNIAVCHQSIGTLYIIKNDFKNAKSELQKAGKHFKEVGYWHQYLTVINNLGVLHKRQKQYSKAMRNYKETLTLSEQLKNKSMQSTALLNMSQIAALQKQYGKALSYITKSFKLAKAANETDFREIYQDLANIYELKGDYKQAIKWLTKYTHHADSILNIKKYKAVEEIKIKYESEKKELLIKKISLENDKKQATILRERIIAGSITTLFILVVIFLLIIRRESLLKIESYKVLVAKNEQYRVENEKKRLEKLNTPLKNGDNIVPLETRKAILSKLNVLIKEKFYTDITLTLSSTAKRTDSNSKYLSQVVNDTFECNFSNFIKQLRIEESQRLLCDTTLNNYTMEVIGEMAGFKSKSVFNTSFKQLTGVTPSFYKRQVQKS